MMLAAAFAALFGCAGSPAAVRIEAARYPAVRFMVFSDPHLYDLSLSSPGASYTRNLESGPELSAESADILSEVINKVKEAAPAFVIIPGDLTRNGEKASHLLMAQKLSALTDAGIKVFVVPGNHDVANPYAAGFVGDGTVKVDTISPEDFSRIYAPYGYAQAVSRDPSSLSYAAEPVPGLWLLGIDDCRYRDNGARMVSGGRVGEGTYAWMQGVLHQARAEGKAVIAVMHHGAMQHFTRQDVYRDWMAASDHERLARFLADAGVALIFTGHGHAQDITVERWKETPAEFLYDVETGSLIQYPNAYRTVDIGEDGLVRITSAFIDGIRAYSEARLREAIKAQLSSILADVGVTGKGAGLILDQGAEAGIDFFRGDEPGFPPRLDTAGMDPWSAFIAGFLGQVLADVGTDLSPVDNAITIDPLAGTWSP